MNTYEAMFLVDNRHANRDWDRVVDQAKEMVAKHGGRMLHCEKWGERKLAYPIKGNKRGTYLLAYFESEADAPNRVYREVELSETFLRGLVLAVGQLPKGVAPADTPPEEQTEAPAAETPAKEDAGSAEGTAAAEAPADTAKAEGAPDTPGAAEAPASG